MPRLTEADLAAIEAREQATSPGPWTCYCQRVVCWDSIDPAAFDYRVVVSDPSMRSEDATFIAHARHDIPALLAEVRRLRQALHMIATIASDDGCSDAYVSRAALVAALEALKDADPSHGIQSVHYSSGQMGQQRLHAAKEDPS